MACPIGCIGTISAVIVALQFLSKVVPWLYENIIGPSILGPKLKIRNYGDWACKFIDEITEFSSEKIDFINIVV